VAEEKLAEYEARESARQAAQQDDEVTRLKQQLAYQRATIEAHESARQADQQEDEVTRLKKQLADQRVTIEALESAAASRNVGTSQQSGLKPQVVPYTNPASGQNPFQIPGLIEPQCEIDNQREAHRSYANELNEYFKNSTITQIFSFDVNDDCFGGGHKKKRFRL
jgi:hypothetical protein